MLVSAVLALGSISTLSISTIYLYILLLVFLSLAGASAIALTTTTTTPTMAVAMAMAMAMAITAAPAIAVTISNDDFLVGVVLVKCTDWGEGDRGSGVCGRGARERKRSRNDGWGSGCCEGEVL